MNLAISGSLYLGSGCVGAAGAAVVVSSLVPLEAEDDDDHSQPIVSVVCVGELVAKRSGGIELTKRRVTLNGSRRSLRYLYGPRETSCSGGESRPARGRIGFPGTQAQVS